MISKTSEKGRKCVWPPKMQRPRPIRRNFESFLTTIQNSKKKTSEKGFGDSKYHLSDSIALSQYVSYPNPVSTTNTAVAVML